MESVQMESLERSFDKEVYLTACYTGDTTTVVQQLEVASTTDVNSMNDRGWTALHIAAYFGHLEIVKHLLAAKVDVNARSENGDFKAPGGWCGTENRQGGFTALQYAAESPNKSVEIIEALLNAGADVHSRNEDGGNVASSLVSRKSDLNREILQLLVKAGVDLNVSDRFGFYPIHQIIVRDDVSLLSAFLDAGASTDVIYERTKSALLAFTFEYHQIYFNCAKELIRRKITLGKDIRGFMPLNSLFKRSIYEDGCKWALTDMKWSTQLEDTMVKKKDIFYDLLKAGVELDAKDPFGNTPLYSAVSRNFHDFAIELIARGCDVKTKSGSCDWSLLCWAAANGNGDLIKILADKGLDINERCSSPDGLPVLLAIQRNRLSAVKALVELGVSLSAKGSQGRTLIDIAVQAGSKEIENYLRSCQ